MLNFPLIEAELLQRTFYACNNCVNSIGFVDIKTFIGFHVYLAVLNIDRRLFKRQHIELKKAISQFSVIQTVFMRFKSSN